MARLVVGKSDKFEIAGLAKNKRFSTLSEKRITMAVRETLRRNRGNEVKVSCTAHWYQGMWMGTCWIDGVKRMYQVHSA